MKRLNQINVDTSHGRRRIELFHGDLTDLPFEIDLLVVSAFRGDYAPVPGTLIESLAQRLGIVVEDLEADCEIRKPQLGFWISRGMEKKPFQRILGIELRGVNEDLQELLENIFVAVGLLEHAGSPIRSMALPLPGAGEQGYLPAEVISHLLPAALRELEQAAHLERIVIAERSAAKARALDRAFDEASSGAEASS